MHIYLQSHLITVSCEENKVLSLTLESPGVRLNPQDAIRISATLQQNTVNHPNTVIN